MFDMAWLRPHSKKGAIMPLSAAVHNRGQSDALCYIPGMSRDEILARLREFEPAERGIAHAALFGSAARGDNGPDSDIDIMVEFDPQVILSVYEYVALKNYIAELFGAPVDVVNRAGLTPIIGPAITAEALYAF
jgi:predicted nucleotidyltransferase